MKKVLMITLCLMSLNVNAFDKMYNDSQSYYKDTPYKEEPQANIGPIRDAEGNVEPCWNCIG